MPMVRLPDGWLNPEHVERLSITRGGSSDGGLIIQFTSGRECVVTKANGAERVEREILEATAACDVILSGPSWDAVRTPTLSELQREDGSS